MGAITAAVVTAAGAAYSANQSKKAAKDQIRANEKAMDTTNRMASQARGDAQRLFDEGKQSQRMGYQGAVDLLSGGMTPQANMMNQGNMAAQQNLLAGGRGFQSAILGTGGDPYAGLQTSQVQPDFSFLNNYVQQNPIYQQPGVQQATTAPNPFNTWRGNQAAANANLNIGNILGGYVGGGMNRSGFGFGGGGRLANSNRTLKMRAS